MSNILIVIAILIGVSAGLIGLWILFGEYQEYRLNKTRLKVKFDFQADALTHYLSVQSLGRKPVFIKAVRYFITPSNRWEKWFKGISHGKNRWLYKQEFKTELTLTQGENPPIAIQLPEKLKIYKIYKAELIDQWGDEWAIDWPTPALRQYEKANRHQLADFAIESREERTRLRRRTYKAAEDPYSISAIAGDIADYFKELQSLPEKYRQQQRDKMRLRSVAHFDFKTRDLSNNTISFQLLSEKPVMLTTIRYFIMPNSLWKRWFRERQHRRGRWLWEQQLAESAKISLKQGEHATLNIELPPRIKLHRIYKAQVISQGREYADVQWPSLSRLSVFAPKKLNPKDLFVDIENPDERRRRRDVIQRQKDHTSWLKKLRQTLENWQTQRQQHREENQNRSHLIVKAQIDFDNLKAANHSIAVQSLGKRAVSITTVRYFIMPHGFWRKLFRNRRHRKGRWLWDQELSEKIRLNEGEQTIIAINLPQRVRLSSIYKVEVIEQNRQRWSVSQWPSLSQLAVFAPFETTKASHKTPEREIVRERVRKRKSIAGDNSVLHGTAYFSFTSPTQANHHIVLQSTGKSPVIIDTIRYYLLPRSKWKQLFKNWQHRKGLWFWNQNLMPTIKVIENEQVSVAINLSAKIKIHRIYKVDAIDQLGRHWAIDWPTLAELDRYTHVEQLNFFEKQQTQRFCQVRGFRLGEGFYLDCQFGVISGKTEQLKHCEFRFTDINSYEAKYHDLYDNQCKRFLNAEIDGMS